MSASEMIRILVKSGVVCGNYRPQTSYRPTAQFLTKLCRRGLRERLEEILPGFFKLK